MTIGKIFEFVTKPEHLGLSSSMRLEFMKARSCFIQILCIQYISDKGVFICTQVISKLRQNFPVV